MTLTQGNEPFAAVLGAPSAKRSALSTPDLGSKNTPTIVFVSIQSDYVDNELFESTRRVLADFPTSKRTIVLVSRCKADLDDGQNFQGIKSINVLPVRTSDMQQQLLADRRAEKGHRNLRLLQRRIRHRFPESEGSLLTRPHAPWPLAHDPTVARQLFTEHRLKSSVINDILEAIANRLDDDRIRKAVLDFCRHKVALGAWSRNFSAVCVPDDLDDKHDPWRNFPVRVREVLNMISGNKGKYEWENHSLHLLVDPVEAEEAWASIAVDEDLVASVKRVVAHHQSPRGPGTSYGILKQEHTGGALFYGPPGTGKTLLARVLAHSTDSIVISATAADIQSVWCGEAPKVVKGLFNLARLIAPSIIFIDEADALFGARNSSRGYQSTFYQSTTTQLLNEMDGFSKSMDTPLVILATNLPGTLDPAVLRRVPNFTYMGLPTLALREQIFRIMLREEILAPDVSIVNLARMTNGFSGSDIKSLCVQVALSCDTLVATGEKTGKRLLTWSLFQRALARATPSASEASMAGLRDFAREFDPLAFQKMNAAASEKAHN